MGSTAAVWEVVLPGAVLVSGVIIIQAARSVYRSGRRLSTSLSRLGNAMAALGDQGATGAGPDGGQRPSRDLGAADPARRAAVLRRVGMDGWSRKPHA